MEIRKIEKRKNKVAILIDTWFPIYSGEQIHVLKLAKALAERGIEVSILTRRIKGSLSKDVKEFEKTEGIIVRRLGFTRLDYLIISFFVLLFSWKSFNSYHAHTAISAIAMKAASWFTKRPTIMTVHGNHVFDSHWTAKKIIDRVMCLETKYTQEISISENFLKATNVNDHVLVIPNGVDLDLFDEIESEKTTGSFKALFVGRLVHTKGIGILLEAVKNVVESNEFIQSKRDFALEIVGEGNERKDLEKQAEKLGISHYVKFHGKLSDENLRRVYKSANLFVLPSRTEGLPQTLLEACAAKLAILASDVGDNKKVVIENVNGHLVHPEDVEELSYYLGHFALNPGLEQMGEASYDIVRQEYSWESTIAKNLRVYESLLKSKRKKQKKVKKEGRFMPWEVPRLYLERRKTKKTYHGRSPLRFCLTINVESPHEITHDLEYIEPFLKRFSEFSESLGINVSYFFENDLIENFLDIVKQIQNDKHEIGVIFSKKTWSDGPEIKKKIRELPDVLEDLDLKKIRMIRAHGEVGDAELELLHEKGFEYLPVSEDPMPQISWHYRLMPTGKIVRFDLKSIISMTDEELLDAVNRLRAFHKANGVDPFLIFECSSWEFQSREDLDYTSGENFTALSKKIAMLKDHMEIDFMTLSDFCKSCMVQE